MVALFGEVDGTVPFVVAVTDAGLAAGLEAGELVNRSCPTSPAAAVAARSWPRDRVRTRPASAAAIASLRATLGGSNG